MMDPAVKGLLEAWAKHPRDDALPGLLADRIKEIATVGELEVDNAIGAAKKGLDFYLGMLNGKGRRSGRRATRRILRMWRTYLLMIWAVECYNPLVDNNLLCDGRTPGGAVPYKKVTDYSTPG